MAAAEERDTVVSEERLRINSEAVAEEETAPGTEAPKLCFRWDRHRGTSAGTTTFRVFQHALHFHTSCLVGNKIYLFVGSAEAPWSTQQVFCLDYKRGEWSKVRARGPAPLPRYAHTTTLVGDKVVMIAGESAEKIESDVYLFDLVAEVWDKAGTVGDVFSRCKGHSADFAGEYKKVIVFQQPADRPAVNNTYLLDPEFWQWKLVVPKGRYILCVTVAGSLIDVVFGLVWFDLV